MKEYKSNIQCFKCHENHPATLDFHHLNKNEKEYNVSDMVTTQSKSRILKEIEKCVILCSNCHRKEHWVDNSPEA